MPVIIAPVDAYPANFTTFADGDAVSQANFVNSMQEFADAITYLRNRTVPATPFVSPLAMGGEAGQTGAAYSYNMVSKLWAETLGAGDSITWAVDFGPALPAGSGPFQITSIDCWTINNAGHGGLSPAAGQSLSLDYHQPSSGVALQNVASFSDASAGAVLDTLHAFGSGALAHPIVSGASYSVTYTGESGANAQPDTDLHGIFFTIEAV